LVFRTRERLEKSAGGYEVRADAEDGAASRLRAVPAPRKVNSDRLGSDTRFGPKTDK
jgi:hypothetical protein